MSPLISSANVTDEKIIQYLNGKGQIKVPLAGLTAQQFLAELKDKVALCKPFVEYAGATAEQVVRSLNASFDRRKLNWILPVGYSERTRVVRISDDFALSLWLDTPKEMEDSFPEFASPPGTSRRWLHHFLLVGEYGQFVLLSQSQTEDDASMVSDGEATVRLLEPSEQFLVNLFTRCLAVRLVSLQRLGATLDQQAVRYEKWLKAIREAQNALHTTLDRVA